VIISCDDTPGEQIYTCATCVTEPEAQSIYDTSHFGIYKGVITGFDYTLNEPKSGTYKITIHESEYSVDMTYMDSSYTFQTTDTTEQIEGTEYSYTFSKTFASAVYTLIIILEDDGEVQETTFTVDSDEILAVSVKETSTGLVKCFEGTYSGDAWGAWNMLMQNNRVYGAYDSGTFDGQFIADYIDGEFEWVAGFPQPDPLTADFNGEEATGTWGIDTMLGTWAGKRTR